MQNFKFSIKMNDVGLSLYLFLTQCDASPSFPHNSEHSLINDFNPLFSNQQPLTLKV